MSDRAPSQGAEANAEVPAGRFRSSARGLARAMRSVPGSVVLSFIILIAVAVCVFFSPLIVPNALGQDVSLGVSPAGTPGHIFGTDKVGRDILGLTIGGMPLYLVLAKSCFQCRLLCWQSSLRV